MFFPEAIIESTLSSSIATNLTTLNTPTMSTPESQAFLAKKPTVAPTFDGVDFADNQAVANARDAIVREQWVGLMMQRLVGEEMGMSILL